MIAAGQPSLDEAEVQAVMDVVRGGRLTQGLNVEAFEKEFAARMGMPYAIACSNGTAALHLALAALEIGPGDEVIVPATTFVATVNAVRYVGATPVIVDVLPTTWCIDPDAVQAAITGRTRAIIPVHLYGVPADPVLVSIATLYGLDVIEDAAEAFGASPIGLGTMTTFSFYGNKTITTGEGGMIVTQDAAIVERLRSLRGQGQEVGKRYWHDRLGFNYRMTEMQAAIGRVQLSKADRILAQRRVVNRYYREHLGDLVRFQMVPELYADGEQVVPVQEGAWAVAGLIEHAADLMSFLAYHDIETRPVFPPMHFLPMYEQGQSRPVAEALHHQGIVLPTHAELSVDDCARVVRAVRDWAAQ